MYIARLTDNAVGRRYIIRQSYADGPCYRSRDLFDLGANPARFIIYPGGNGFYIDPVVEDAIAAQGITVTQDDLEPIFMPFLAPHIQRVIEGFDRKSRHRQPENTCLSADSFHIFDRRRLHYLRSGRVDRREMGCTPERFYAKLQQKSRDEIEYDFIAAERILREKELARYTYQIFDLQKYFSEHFARSHPEALALDRMDTYFLKALCQLNQDRSFWVGSKEEPGLRMHLVRYVIMYFDSFFPTCDPFQDFLHAFMNRHRIHRPPQSVRMNMAESARILGLSIEELQKMDCRMLTRQYRKQALKYHPDKGGDQEVFLKLTTAYEKILKRKKAS